ncbi:uncharacterized protein RCC_04036 [Ramularia collo-cygni]|uniref:RING-type domain-containing protein n=1 Tax=Ramularia collo-cygni TaxID=112498 RepID=A0A2D3V3T3_9PEZI|nr:uncharacterized protein RCC_04036 [Ramularia collo-cygni]CZT18196.1 uncharacterized protein RCC_04036 [Ramularia collo-cygni]
MLSRTEFLATGLAPVTNTSDIPAEGCSICTDPFKEPVALPCKHIFCKECIVEWLSLPVRNTCPFCREECFTRTVPGPRGPVAIRREPLTAAQTLTVSRALANSGLTTGQFDIFSDDISWDTSSIQRATAAANHWLYEQNDVVGPAFVNKRRLGTDIIAMGNLIRAYASAAGRPYSAGQVGEWRIVIDVLYRSIEARNGSSEDAMILTWLLNSDVRLGLLRAVGTQRSSTFVEDQGAETPSGDINRLINYVAFRASEEESRRRQRRQDIRDEPNPFARVGMRVQNIFRG